MGRSDNDYTPVALNESVNDNELREFVTYDIEPSDDSDPDYIPEYMYEDVRL